MTSPGGLIGASGTNTASSVPTNADGTPNFGGILPTGTGSTSVPVDGTGAIDYWNLPSFITDYEKNVSSKPFLWSQDQPTTAPDKKANAQYRNPQFGEANGLGLPEDLNHEVSADDIMKQFNAMAFNDPGQYRVLQEALAAGPWGKVTVDGKWNSSTQSALSNAMIGYLQTTHGASVPITFPSYILGLGGPTDKNGNPILPADGNASSGSGGGYGTGLGGLYNRPTLTDPAQLRMYAQSAAEQSLGHLLTEDQLNNFVNEFQTQQANSYLQSMNHQGLYVDKSNPTGAAAAFVQQADPTGFAEHKVTGYADALLNDLLGGKPNLPDQGVDQTIGMTQ